MKYLLIALLFISSFAAAQTNTSATYTVIIKADANVLPSTIPAKDTAVVFTYRVYGVNQQYIYYWHMGQPTGDSTASYMAQHYIIVPTGQTRGYWTTVNTPVGVDMVIGLTKAINAQIAAQGLKALTTAGALTYDPNTGILTSLSYTKAHADSVAKGKVDTAYISTAKTLYYAKSNPQKFIPRDSLLAINGATFNKSNLTIGTDGTLQTATQVNNAITAALSAGGYASATSVTNERTRAQTAELNLSTRITNDSSRVAGIPVYTANNGVVKTGSNFSSDTTYNRTVSNSFTKAQTNTAIAAAIATIPVYSAGYGILKTSNTFSSDTTSATGVVSKSRLTSALALFQRIISAGTGISIVNNVVTNTAPDKTVTITNAGGTTIGGTYPNFTIATGPYVYNTLGSGGRPIGTSFQISTTRPVIVNYTINATTTLSLLNLNSSANIDLQVSADNTTFQSVNGAGITNGLAVSVSVGLNTTNQYNISCVVPPGYYVKLVSTTSGGGTTTFVKGQETTL